MREILGKRFSIKKRKVSNIKEKSKALINK